MEPDGILESVLYAGDLEAAERFYRDVLGLRLHAKAPGRHVFFRCAGQMLLIFNPTETRLATASSGLAVPAHGASGPGHLCFRASPEQLIAWRERLASRGIGIESEIEWPGGGASIYFRDPAGNSLEFAEPRIWGLS